MKASWDSITSFSEAVCCDICEVVEDEDDGVGRFVDVLASSKFAAAPFSEFAASEAAEDETASSVVASFEASLQRTSSSSQKPNH